MRLSHEGPQNNKTKHIANKRPSLIGDTSTDWSLWQLAQVLREIAQSSTQSKDNTANRKEDSDNENK